MIPGNQYSNPYYVSNFSPPPHPPLPPLPPFGPPPHPPLPQLPPVWNQDLVEAPYDDKIILYIKAHGNDTNRSISRELLGYTNIDYRIFYESPSHGCVNYTMVNTQDNVDEMNLLERMYKTTHGHIDFNTVNEKLEKDNSLSNFTYGQEPDSYLEMIRKRKDKYITDNYFKPGLDHTYQFFAVSKKDQDYDKEQELKKCRGIFIVYTTLFELFRPFTEQTLEYTNLITPNNYYHVNHGLFIKTNTMMAEYEIYDDPIPFVSLIDILKQLSIWYNITHPGKKLKIELYDTSCRSLIEGYTPPPVFSRTKSIEKSLKGISLTRTKNKKKHSKNKSKKVKKGKKVKRKCGLYMSTLWFESG